MPKTSSRYELALAGNVVACIFFLKCQGGWRELQQVDVSIVDAEQQAEAQKEQLRLVRAMTPEERQTIRENQHRAQEIIDRARQRLPQTARKQERS